jgi:hypothetical protein
MPELQQSRDRPQSYHGTWPCVVASTRGIRNSAHYQPIGVVKGVVKERQGGGGAMASAAVMAAYERGRVADGGS